MTKRIIFVNSIDRNTFLCKNHSPLIIPMLTNADKNLVLYRYAYGKEDKLIEAYILKGPSQIKEELGIGDEEWQVIFEYLVFEKNLLYKCAKVNLEFFMDIYVKYGIEHVRSVLDIAEKKYDKVWEIVFDFMAIAHDGLYQHAIYNREKYAEILQVKGDVKVKKLLGINKDKYINFWERILNMLLETAVNNLISDRTAEFALKAFTMMMNVGRRHRIIK